MFDQLVMSLMEADARRDQETVKITQQQWHEWQQQVILDALKGVPYGRSFCEHFRTMDLRLWLTADSASCDRIIAREYLL